MTLGADDFAIAAAELSSQSSWGRRNEVPNFEREFATWVGTKYAVAFDTARGALFTLLKALKPKGGCDVLVPGYTCVVVFNSVRFAGLTPVFYDIELETFGPSAKDIRKKLSTKTELIIIQHLYGLVSRDYEEVVDLARSKGLCIIEDCAQATGATFRGNKLGVLGDCAIFSSEQSKVMCTIRGGIAVTSDASLYQRIKSLRDAAPSVPKERISAQLRYLQNLGRKNGRARQWQIWKAWPQHSTSHSFSYTPEELVGNMPEHYNAPMAGPIAVLALNQLKKVDSLNEQRRRNARYWDRWCDMNGWNRPRIIPFSEPVFLRYPVLVSREMKQNRSWAERDLGIELGVWFRSNLHPVDVPVYDCPNANKAVMECVNFPTLW